MAGKDIVDVIVDDHREFRRMFQQMDEVAVDQRGDLFRHMVAELARHEAAEESLVHPALRDEAPGGDEIASQVLEEESEAEKLMARMEDMDPASDEFLAAFRDLREDVLSHADHEERDEHPLLRSSLDGDRRMEMADRFERLKDVAPTHPHPLTPQKPEVRKAAGPVAGIFDRARDAARKLFS